MSRQVGVCAYYNAPGGCSRGTRCTYKHEGIEGVGVSERPNLVAATAEGESRRKKNVAGGGDQHAAINARLLRQAPAAASSSFLLPHASSSSSASAATDAAHADMDSTSLTGQWTRGTPWQPKKEFKPKTSQPIMQLGAIVPSPSSTPSTSLPLPSEISHEQWTTVNNSKQRPPSASASATTAASTSSSSSGPPQRGLLHLPPGSFPSAPSAKPVPHPHQQQVSKKPKPKASWSMADRLDLSSLSKLDAITSSRPLLSDLSSRSTGSADPDSNFPLLAATKKAAWASSINNNNAASASFLHASTAATSSALASSSNHKTKPPQPIRSASAKPKSVSFVAAASEKTKPPKRPKSASVKPHKKKSSSSSSDPSAPRPHKLPKPTQLKRALLKERLTNFIRHDIVENILVRGALQLGPPPPSSTASTAQLSLHEKEQALAAIRRRVAKAQYDAKQVDIIARREEKAKLALEKAERNKQARAERQAQEREERLAAKAAAAGSLASSFSSTIALSSVLVTDRPTSSIIAPPSEPAPVSLSSSSTASLPPQQDSSIQESHPLTAGSVQDAAQADEKKEEGQEVHEDAQEDTTGSSDTSESESDEDGPPPPSTAAASESKGGHDEEDVDDDNESEFIPALAQPSSHIEGHFPSATPPDITALSNTSGSASSSSSTPAASSASSSLRMLRSLAIPSHIALTPQEQALLLWHFQREHHGTQPSLVGAVKRHCRQMWKKEIDQLVVTILKDLRRFHERAKDLNPLKAAQKVRYVSGLKQTWKGLKLGRIRAVVVACNIEKQESAIGGLDDLLDEIMVLAEEKKVPIVFALDRQGLGRALGTSNSASAVGLVDYSGAGDQFKALLKVVDGAREEWGMFQEDSWLNPRPPDWEEQQRRAAEILESKRLVRAAAKTKHESQVSLAEAAARARIIAERQGENGGAKKKKKTKSSATGSSFTKGLAPLPVLNEEDQPRKRRRKKGANPSSDSTATIASSTSASSASSSSATKLPSTSATTSQQLKGAGRALTAIAESLAADNAAPSTHNKSNKKASGNTATKALADEVPTLIPAPNNKKHGKSDKKGGKRGKSNK